MTERPATPDPSHSDAQPRDLAELRHDDFAPHTGSEFHMAHGDITLGLTLERVAPLPEHSGLHREPFSLEFTGPDRTAFGQGTYRLRHDTLGLLDVFLVPVAKRGDRITYEAIFT